LTLALLASPLIHAAALLLGARWLTYGSHRLWDGLVYLLIAPIVGTLMLRRHERARFSAYVFLSWRSCGRFGFTLQYSACLPWGSLLTCSCQRRARSTRRSTRER
jgi:hypothetical protein